MAGQKEKKSEIINIRITPEQRRLIDDSNLSPTEIFNKMVNVGVLEKRKETAKQNLEKYPCIKALFHENWVLAEINRLKFNKDGDVFGNGLAWLLSVNPDEKVLKHIEENKKLAEKGNVDAGMMAYLQGSFIYEPLLKLEELEQNLLLLKNESKIARTIKKAQNEDQFWQTLSEIEVAAYFKRKGLFKEFEPKIEGKTPDILANLDGNDFCIEVFTPSLAKELEEAMRKGEAITLGNRAWGKLDEKLNQLPKKTPSIIVINRAFSEIDAINVADAIMGSLSLLLPKDPKLEPKVFRKNDGLAGLRSLDNVKAIVLYKRVFDFNKGLVTIPEIKPVKIEGGKNISKKQEALLGEAFQSMIFGLERIHFKE